LRPECSCLASRFTNRHSVSLNYNVAGDSNIPKMLIEALRARENPDKKADTMHDLRRNQYRYPLIEEDLEFIEELKAAIQGSDKVMPAVKADIEDSAKMFSIHLD